MRMVFGLTRFFKNKSKIFFQIKNYIDNYKDKIIKMKFISDMIVEYFFVFILKYRLIVFVFDFESSWVELFRVRVDENLFLSCSNGILGSGCVFVRSESYRIPPPPFLFLWPFLISFFFAYFIKIFMLRYMLI